MRKIKKITSIILVMSLCLGLCACGAIENSDERISAKLKGSGSSQLKLTVFTEVPEGYSWTASMPAASDELPFEVTLVSSKPGTDRFSITSGKEGTFTLIIAYENKEGDRYAYVSMLLAADTKGKISCSSMIVSGRDEFKKHEDENFSGNDFEISNYQSSVKDIRLITKDGIWSIGDYDESVISVEDLGVDEEFSNFRIYGLKTGVTDLILFNEKGGLQAVLSIAVTEDSSESIDTVYNVAVTSVRSESYDKTQAKEYIEAHDDAMNSILEFVSDPCIANGAVFDSSKLSIEGNTMQVKMEYKGINVFCNAVKGTDLNAYVSDYINGINITSETVVNIGGTDVQCKIAEEGFGMAFFEKDGVVWSILAADSFTAESFTAFISEYMQELDFHPAQ